MSNLPSNRLRLLASKYARSGDRPAGDYGLVEKLRVRAAREGRNTNKSEVIRAGLQSLMVLEPSKLIAILDALEKVKPGRK